MRTNIDLNDQLTREAALLTGIQVKKHLIEYALKELIASKKRQKMSRHYGQITWEGDLDKMRRY